MKYDKYMDKECINLCNKLNSLRGIKTTESCCGHYKKKYCIYMNVSNFNSLSIISRCVDSRYAGNNWKLYVLSGDNRMSKIGYTYFVLESKRVFKNEKILNKYVNKFIRNIDYWKELL